MEIQYLIKLLSSINSAWIPSVREGLLFRTWIDIDLREVTRINWVEVGQPASVGIIPTRPAKRVALYHYHDSGGSAPVLDVDDHNLEDTPVMELPSAVEAKRWRLEVLEGAAGDQGAKPLAVKG